MDAPVVIEYVSVPSSWDINAEPCVTDTNNTENGNKGFPFDDSGFETTDRGSFHSHLDDLARRHPELAEHLNFDQKFKEFPFQSNTWGHNRRGSLFTDDNSEPTTFRQSSRFGSPLSSSVFDKDFPFHREEPATPHEQEPKEAEKPPQVPTNKERSRKTNPNVPQSNTVDLGQKQEPVKDTREQRSMSAPPENRAGQQRFVSSINIPVQGENAQQPSQSHQTKQQPQQMGERVIPIHVEGRDEPVLPKNATNHSYQQPHQAQPDRNFNQRPTGGFGSSWNRGDAPYYTGDPHFQREEPHNFFNNSHHNEGFSNAAPFKQQKPAPPTSHFQNSQQPQNPPQQPPQPPQPQHQASSSPPPPPPNVKLGPIDQIRQIQKDVLALMGQVEKFNGKPKDKDYVYLDEMLTRNLLKLDDVETEGKDTIRNARKEAIKCIQRCISILEAKANANELLHNQLIDISTGPPLTSLEISGISRSGSEAPIQNEAITTPEEQQQPDSSTAEICQEGSITPMQTNEAEPIAPSDNSLTAQQTVEPTKNQDNPLDIEMASQSSNAETTQATESSEGAKDQQPMDVEEPKEKKDKKKVKKKVDKTEKQ